MHAYKEAFSVGRLLTVEHAEDGLVAHHQQGRSLSEHLEDYGFQPQKQVLVALAPGVPVDINLIIVAHKSKQETNKPVSTRA